jgi:hypothetical protein
MVLTAIILSGILVINSAFLTEMRVQQVNASDAAALAAAETIAIEALLYADPSIFNVSDCSKTGSLFCTASQSAIAFGAKNYVGGKAFNIEAGDVFFDIVNIPGRCIYGTMPADPTVAINGPALTLQQQRTINAVQVVGRSVNSRGNSLTFPIFNHFGWEMMTRSEAVLDGYVYGFSPYVQGFDPTASPAPQSAFTPVNPIVEGLSIPLAPIAIYSDPQGNSTQSWENQVESTVNFASPTALSYGTMTITLSNGNLSTTQQYDPTMFNATFLCLGTNYCSSPPSKYSSDGLNRTINDQIVNGSGIAPQDYYTFYTSNSNQRLVLDTSTDPPGPLYIAGTPVGPAPATADYTTLKNSLLSLQNTPMIWPLFNGYDASMPPRVIVSGFVVARVSAVQDTTVAGQTCVQAQLTPSLLATRTALTYTNSWPTTQPEPSPYFQFRFPNAYVKRIRLMR